MVVVVTNVAMRPISAAVVIVPMSVVMVADIDIDVDIDIDDAAEPSPVLQWQQKRAIIVLVPVERAPVVPKRMPQ